MHVYIYDDYVNKKKYENTLARLETRITDLGLNGKIVRLDVMKNIADAVEGEMRRGAKTIIAVGNDTTVNKVINAMINAEPGNPSSSDIPLAIIPIGKENNDIASCLGISEGESAGDVLSARRIERLDVAQAGSYYFISSAKINSRDTVLDIEKDYSIEIIDPGEINIINLSTFSNLPQNALSCPQDGLLELYIRNKGSRTITKFKPQETTSLFSLKKLVVNNKKFSLTIDNAQEVKMPAEISVTKKINIIVGKDRHF